MDYEHALKYPVRGDWVPRLLVGAGLLAVAVLTLTVAYLGMVVLVGFLILPLAIIPRVLVDGYYIRVLRNTIAGDAEPPSFEDPTDLFVDGLKSLGITIVYNLPVAIPAVAGFSVAFGLSVAFPDSSVGELAILGMSYVVMPILALCGMVVRYFLAAGLANFAHEDDVWAAFDVGAVRDVSTNATWLIAWAIAWGISLAAGMLNLGGFGYLLLIGFVAEFYASVVGYQLYGQAFAEVREDLDEWDADGEAVAAKPADPSWEPVDDEAS
jgi:hypothetical protein